jgi:hypothetical protein
MRLLTYPTKEGICMKNNEVTKEQLDQSLEYAKWRDSFRRKGFDYQERWHGFGSPVGLGFGFTGLCLGIYLLSLAWTNLQ